jgi:sulfhydrogenase subunit beta (sulfur reductase)
MKYYYLKKNDMQKFLEHLKKKHKVVAPVKKENLFVFDEVDEASSICFDSIPTILPPKKYFTPRQEKLGYFKMGDVSMSNTKIDVEPTIILGAHTCDIEGIECLDVVFNDNPIDPYFNKRKKSMIVIGYECMKPCDEYATCSTMDTHNPKAGYDIMITDHGDKYILHTNSHAGDELLKNLSILKEEKDTVIVKKILEDKRKEKQKKFTSPLEAKYKELNKIFRASYESEIWKDVGKRCVSCGNCTAVCPTCYCFDIYDEVELDMTGGERKRVWDSCQLDEFATVAGGENFRKERSSRQRHRYYRKFDYSIKKYNKFFCVGCGRCTRTCMAKISLIETVNDLTKERKNDK